MGNATGEWKIARHAAMRELFVLTGMRSFGGRGGVGAGSAQRGDSLRGAAAALLFAGGVLTSSACAIVKRCNRCELLSTNSWGGSKKHVKTRKQLIVSAFVTFAGFETERERERRRKSKRKRRKRWRKKLKKREKEPSCNSYL